MRDAEDPRRDARRLVVALGALPDHEHHVVENLLGELRALNLPGQIPLKAQTVALVERLERVTILVRHPADELPILFLRNR